jgi:hypothetical protein
MRKKSFFLMLAILQIFLTSFGQRGYEPGYIITNSFDTLRGVIKLKSNYLNGRSCDFIDAGAQNPKIYSPSDIRGYRIENSKNYVSKEVAIDSTKQRVFLEYLVSGIVDLYYLKELQNEYYFFEKDGILTPLSNEGSMVTVKAKGVQGEYESTYFKTSNQYKRVLTYFFQDSPEVSLKIPQTRFDYRSLINLTVDYHNAVCHDKKCIDFTKSTKQRLIMEVYAGMINSRMGLATSKNYASQSNLFGGLQFRFIPFKSFSRWNFLIGMSYSTNSFQGVFDNTLYTPEYTRTYQIETQYSILRIPLTFDYTFGTGNLQPYLSLSYNNIFLINRTYKIIRTDRGKNYGEDSRFRGYEYGLSPALGFRWKLDDKSYIFEKNEFEFRKSLANFNYILDYQKINSWLISVGYGFRFK